MPEGGSGRPKYGISAETDLFRLIRGLILLILFTYKLTSGLVLYFFSNPYILETLIPISFSFYFFLICGLGNSNGSSCSS